MPKLFICAKYHPIMIAKKDDLKIVIGGHFGAGKTTFVKTVGGTNTLLVEKRTTAKGELKKNCTTVGFDFATIELDGQKLYLFGIPGQYRFNFLWDTLFEGADAGIFLIDRTDKSKWPELFRQIQLFKRKNGQKPIIIAVNKNKMPNALPIEEVKAFLKNLGEFPILKIEANSYDSILSLLKKVKDALSKNFKGTENFFENSAAIG